MKVLNKELSVKICDELIGTLSIVKADATQAPLSMRNWKENSDEHECGYVCCIGGHQSIKESFFKSGLFTASIHNETPSAEDIFKCAMNAFGRDVANSIFGCNRKSRGSSLMDAVTRCKITIKEHALLMQQKHITTDSSYDSAIAYLEKVKQFIINGV